MIGTREQLESPSGLDLNPSPPPTARISKKVGLVAIGIVLLVGTMVVYGLYTRKEQQAVKRQAAEEKRPEPARIAGDQVVREIAPPAVANAASTPAMPNGVGSSKDGALPAEPTLRPPSIAYRDGPGLRNGRGSGNTTAGYASNDGELTPEERLRLAAFRGGTTGNGLTHCDTKYHTIAWYFRLIGGVRSLPAVWAAEFSAGESRKTKLFESGRTNRGTCTDDQCV